MSTGLPVTARITFGLFATSGGLGILAFAVSPLLVTVAVQDLRYTPLAAAKLATAGLVGTAIIALVLSSLAYRVQPRRIALFGAVLAASAAFAASVVGELLRLLAWFAMGAGGGLALTAAGPIISQSKNPSRQAALVAVLTSFFLFVFLVSCSLAAKRWGFQGLCGSVAISALAMIPLAALLPASCVEATSLAQQKASMEILPAALLVLAALFYSMRDSMLWSMSDALASSIGISSAAMGVALGLSGFAGIIGAGIAVWATGSGLSRNAAIFGLASTALLSLASSQVTNPAIFLPIFVTYTASHLFMSPLILGTAAAIDTSGRLVVLVSGINLVGTALGPILGGAAMDAGARSALGVAIIAMAFLSALFFFAALRTWTPQVAAELNS
jgi:hypothetical protein